MKRLMEDEKGVEPTIMKLLVGVILVSIALGIGVSLYRKIGAGASSQLNYSITLSPDSETVPRENSETIGVDLQSLSEYDSNVTLSADGFPENVSGTFSPSEGKPSFGSTLTVDVGSDAPAGTHTITVKGKSEDGDKSASFDLTIE